MAGVTLDRFILRRLIRTQHVPLWMWPQTHYPEEKFYRPSIPMESAPQSICQALELCWAPALGTAACRSQQLQERQQHWRQRQQRQ